MLTNQSIGYMDAPVPKDLDLKEAIDKLRKEKNAIILAHYYQTGDIQDIAELMWETVWPWHNGRLRRRRISSCFVGFTLWERRRRSSARIRKCWYRTWCRLLLGGQLSGSGVRRVCQATSRSYGNLLREYDRRRESGHGCGGYFHERPPDRGELPGRYTDDFRPGS